MWEDNHWLLEINACCDFYRKKDAIDLKWQCTILSTSWAIWRKKLIQVLCRQKTGIWKCRKAHVGCKVAWNHLINIQGSSHFRARGIRFISMNFCGFSDLTKYLFSSIFGSKIRVGWLNLISARISSFLTIPVDEFALSMSMRVGNNNKRTKRKGKKKKNLRWLGDHKRLDLKQVSSEKHWYLWGIWGISYFLYVSSNFCNFFWKLNIQGSSHFLVRKITKIHGKSRKWTFGLFQGNHGNGFQGGGVNMTKIWEWGVDMTKS